MLFYAMRLPNSFVLPFKIADAGSLLEYSQIAKEANPDFIAPYRKNAVCRAHEAILTERRLSGINNVYS